MMREFIKKYIPNSLLRIRQRLLTKLPDKEFKSLSLKDTFENVYNNSIWCNSSNQDDSFCSGVGSHDPNVTSVYLKAIEHFLNSFEKKLNVVDLGCGDFSIGSRVRQYCNDYVACDIVESLIHRNKEKFKGLNVDFRCLDITDDDLPTGDVVFIRQVLQHLSNKKIIKVLQKLKGKYKYLVLTEHLPSNKNFVPNLNKPSGPNIRIGLGENGSGIILTERPFNFKIKDQKVLCEVYSENGIIQSILYTLL